MKLSRIIVMLALGMFVLALAAPAQNKYVGTKQCKMCHNPEKKGKIFDVWSATKHAEAYKTLTTAKANEIAKGKGITKPAAEAKECLECHAKPLDEKIVDKGYDAKDGVQCEICHGAGSAYKNMSIMKDKAKAMAAGLTEFKDKAAIEKFCKTCHNDKSPTFKEFKFDEMWGKIKHAAPKS
jgi:hypothetical protein